MVLKIVQKLLPRRLSGRTPDSESGKLGSSPRGASKLSKCMVEWYTQLANNWPEDR